MTSYPTRSGSFRHFLRSFLQDDGARFREVLTEDQIKRAARLQNLSFGTGKDDIYSLPLTLWALPCGDKMLHFRVQMIVAGNEWPETGSRILRCKMPARTPVIEYANGCEYPGQSQAVAR